VDNERLKSNSNQREESLYLPNLRTNHCQLMMEDNTENKTMQPYVSPETHKLNEPVGGGLFCVRLEEPFDQIVANNPELRIEQNAEGEIVFMSPTGGEAGRRNAKVCFQLESWVCSHSGYSFDSSTLFLLPNGARRSPDASWIATERWKQLSKVDRDGYPPICPDFVVELRSNTDRILDLQKKMEEYIENGARLGWLIDPMNRTVYVYKPGVPTVQLQDVQHLGDEEILPGFALHLTDIWSDSI
jgi:Uma2 family endonuclease